MADIVKANPRAVLGLATGSTPLELYGFLADWNGKGEISFAQTTTFNLDEYMGIPVSDRNSYRSFMNENFFRKIDIDISRTHVLNGNAADVEAECAAYEKAIRDAGGIDVQLLGLGADAHIGFNEPGSSFESRTRRKELLAQTINDNARFFGNDKSKVPTSALTMGIASIMDARSIVLLAFGQHKAKAVFDMVKGPVTRDVPASILQRHPNARIYLDEAAASML